MKGPVKSGNWNLFLTLEACIFQRFQPVWVGNRVELRLRQHRVETDWDVQMLEPNRMPRPSNLANVGMAWNGGDTGCARLLI